MLFEARKLRELLEEAHALARCSAAVGGEDTGCVGGLKLAVRMLAELEGRDGILRVTESSGGHSRG